MKYVLHGDNYRLSGSPKEDETVKPESLTTRIGNARSGLLDTPQVGLFAGLLDTPQVRPFLRLQLAQRTSRSRLRVRRVFCYH